MLKVGDIITSRNFDNWHRKTRNPSTPIGTKYKIFSIENRDGEVYYCYEKSYYAGKAYWPIGCQILHDLLQLSHSKSYEIY